MNKKSIIFISMSLIVVMAIYFLGNKIINSFNKKQEENIAKEENSLKENDNVIESLYKIQFFEYDGMITLYEALVDKNYNLYILISDKIDSNYIEFNENNEKLLNSEKFDELTNKTHDVKLKLNLEQKAWLKKLLNSLEYDLETKELSNNISNTLYIVNQESNKIYSNNNIDHLADIRSLLLTIVEENTFYIDYLIKDDIKTLVKDDNFKEVNRNSKLVNELYSNVFLEEESFEHYIEDKITNNTIITTTMKYLDSHNIKTLSEIPEFADFSIYKVKMQDFKFYAKKLFGNNVQYDLSSYKGLKEDYRCKVYYLSDDKQELFIQYNGCSIEDAVIGEVAFAYEIDNKLVIIDRSLYFDGTSYDYSNADLYNNFVDKKKIKNTFDFDTSLHSGLTSIYAAFSYHGNSATNYSYTFTKDDNGNYYFTDFHRLN